MAAIPDHVKKFMAEYGVAHDEIWPLPGGRSYAVKHSALERIAHKRAITFDPPQIIEADGANGVVTLLVTAHMGSASAWTFGEASPRNNKNAYAWAMAEKRGKDRCVLKLLNTHGAIYSEDEADDFKQVEPPKSVTAVIAKAPPVKEVTEAAHTFIGAMKMAQTVDDLTEWAIAVKPEISKLQEQDQAAIRDAYAAFRTKLAEAEYQQEDAA